MRKISSSKDLIKEILAVGWELARINGSHHIFVNREKKLSVSIPHPVKDMKPGTESSIRKSVGLKRKES